MFAGTEYMAEANVARPQIVVCRDDIDGTEMICGR
jgi:hypothetical protein